MVVRYLKRCTVIGVPVSFVIADFRVSASVVRGTKDLGNTLLMSVSNLLSRPVLAFSSKFSAVYFQCRLCVQYQALHPCADSFDRHHKPSRSRRQVVADASQHRDQQKRQNQKSRFVIPPQVRDKTLSFFKRRAAAPTEVGIVGDARTAFWTKHTSNLIRSPCSSPDEFRRNRSEIAHCGGIFGAVSGGLSQINFW